MTGQTPATPVWSARTGPVDAAFLAASACTEDDAWYLPFDVAGSIAHVRGLAHVGLLEGGEAEALEAALRQAWNEHKQGTWTLDPALEDGHMNLEAYVTARLGAVGRKVHTGRSRNDQVATCIVLYGRHALAQTAQASLAVADALCAQAELHAATPWTARTHGRPAQAATLGFLLTAHAHRFQDVAQACLAAIQAISVSPLGSGAVAGSTLPLDPAYTAQLLGLRPPRNALLETGARDAANHVLARLTQAGDACASLAEELLALYERGALRLAPGLTTGSSLMPHKRNPDVLELCRGHAKAVSGHASAARAITQGMPLGYHRDFQAVKPILTQAAQASWHALSGLEAALGGGSFDRAVLARGADDMQLAATDAAEALVAAGMPFRDAYTHIAATFQAIEAGKDPEAALRATALSADQVQTCLEALTPDPMRRTTLGAPAQVPQQVHALHRASIHLRLATDEALALALPLGVQA